MAEKNRYLVAFARGEVGADILTLQDALDDCPAGFRLHSITPQASGSGYTQKFVVVFEREPEVRTVDLVSATSAEPRKHKGR